jgi:hypothetical protein
VTDVPRGLGLNADNLFAHFVSWFLVFTYLVTWVLVGWLLG